MEKAISLEEASKMTKELKGLWQLIHFSLGQNQALQVILGSTLRTLPPESPLLANLERDLDGYQALMQQDPKSLGMLDGFASVRSALAKQLDQQAMPPTGGASNAKH